MALKEISVGLDATALKVGIVVSRFNTELTDQLLQSALAVLDENGASEDNITVVRVPGAAEIPFAIDNLAASGEFDAFLGLGCVIQGKTKHADVIVRHVSHSLDEISKRLKRPVIDGVVSAENRDDAITRCGIKARNRGKHATEAMIEMANLRIALD